MKRNAAVRGGTRGYARRREATRDRQPPAHSRLVFARHTRPTSPCFSSCGRHSSLYTATSFGTSRVTVRRRGCPSGACRVNLLLHRTPRSLCVQYTLYTHLVHALCTPVIFINRRVTTATATTTTTTTIAGRHDFFVTPADIVWEDLTIRQEATRSRNRVERNGREG